MDLVRRHSRNGQATGKESTATLPANNIVERFLDDFWQPFGVMPRLNQWMPRVDVEENDKNFQITADIPGVDPKDVTVEIVGDTLQLHGQSSSEHRERKAQYYRLERQSGEFSRSFTLPPNLDTQNIDAEIKHGAITITIPKTPQAQPERRKIDVHAADEQQHTKNVQRRDGQRKTIE